MIVGKDFFALDGLWLEAVVRYRQQEFTPHIQIGDRVSFSGQVHITCIDRITIGNQVLFGSKVYVSDHNHGCYSGERQSPPGLPPADRLLAPGGPVVIEDHVWIGDNVVIVGPTRIGYGAIVAANAVVLSDVPPATIVGGVPAKPLKRFNPVSNAWEKV
jgi:lipopolysaccharide O-acetyltransferase